MLGMTTLKPSQILALGRSYAAHAAELGNPAPDAAPLLFWKPIGSLAAGGVTRLPRWSEGPTVIHYEGEVALVLGRALGPGTPALPADPWEVVSHIAAAIDLSDRDMQKLEPQWVRAKGFAGACALSEPAVRPEDPTELWVRTQLNGTQVQEGRTSQLLFPIRGVLTYIHAFLSLNAGDVILTGTPAGVGGLSPKDLLEVSIGSGPFGEEEGPALASVRLELQEGPQVPSFFP